MNTYLLLAALLLALSNHPVQAEEKNRELNPAGETAALAGMAMQAGAAIDLGIQANRLSKEQLKALEEYEPMRIQRVMEASDEIEAASNLRKARKAKIKMDELNFESMPKRGGVTEYLSEKEMKANSAKLKALSDKEYWQSVRKSAANFQAKVAAEEPSVMSRAAKLKLLRGAGLGVAGTAAYVVGGANLYQEKIQSPAQPEETPEPAPEQSTSAELDN